MAVHPRDPVDPDGTADQLGNGEVAAMAVRSDEQMIAYFSTGAGPVALNGERGNVMATREDPKTTSSSG